MKALLVIFSLLCSPYAFSNCFEASEKDVDIEFTAFKTPSKVGVKGNLKEIKLQKVAKSKDWTTAMTNNTLTIDASKVSTGNPARDKKIAKFFFENKKFKAVVKKINTAKKVISLDVSFQGYKTRTIPMNYTFEKNVLMASGYMDILDFGMSKQLKAINKACLALHEGKTWSDVSLNLKVNFRDCK